MRLPLLVARGYRAAPIRVRRHDGAGRDAARAPVMRGLALVLLVAAGAARAQTPDTLVAAPSVPAPAALLVGVGAACGALAGLGAAGALDGYSVQTPVALGALAGGSAACVWGIGRRAGHGGAFLPTLLDAAVGVGVGVIGGLGVGYVVYYAAGGERSGGQDRFFNDAAVAALLAYGATVAVTPALVAALRLPRHDRPVAAAPAVLRAPDGTTAPGVALRVGL